VTQAIANAGRPAAPRVQRRRPAFTLIELLVGVAIIALLIAIVMPALTAARRQGQITACQAKLREVSQALWAYSVANDGRVPHVISPMVNGKFNSASVGDAEIDPFDRDLWPESLQNVLMPLYLGDDRRIFACPAGNRGWPRRDGGMFQMTYRDAGANQPSGQVAAAGQYEREAFGFLDGRPMVEFRPRFSGNALQDALIFSYMRGTFLRDMVLRDGPRVIGPHNGGINVINREFGVEFRSRRTIQPDLAPNGAGVAF
jgi:prepilin-type N-terminal cleavage/methylation domain-containing protein